MSLYKFSLKHSLRNISQKKGSSLIIILTMSLLMMVMILSVSMFSILKGIFTYEARSTYGDVDIVMTYDENSSSRLINVRDLKEMYQDQITYASAFFSVNTLFSSSGENDFFYANLLAGTSISLEQVLNVPVSALGTYDCVITLSLSSKLNLQVGDEVSFLADNNDIQLKIVSIIEDTGIFTGDQIFFLKSTFSEEVYQLSNMDNLGNVVFIKLNDDVSIETFLQSVSEDSQYSAFISTRAIDPFEIERASRYASVLFFGISVLMLISLFFVLYSLFLLFFKDFQKEQGIIMSLGGSKKYLHIVFLNTFIWFLVFSILFSSVLTFIVLNIGIRIYGIDQIFYYPLWSILLSTLIVILGYSLLALIIQRQLSKQSSISMISQGSNKREKQNVNIYFVILVLFEALLIVLQPFSVGVNSILITLTAILGLFQLIDIFLRIIHKHFRRNSVFQLISFRNLTQNKIVHQSLRVMVVIFIVLISVISVRSFIDREADVVINQVHADYMILGIYDYDDSMISAFQESYHANSSSAFVMMDPYIYFGDEIKRVKYSVSMPIEQFTEYFSFPLIESSTQVMTGTEAYVILPYSLKYIYEVEVGDMIQVDFSKEYQDIEVLIGGFFDTNFDNIMYTNFNQLEANAVFIQSDEGIYNELIEQYAFQFYYVVDMNDFMDDFLGNIHRANDLFIFLSGVLTVSFIIVLFNNTILVFESQKPTFAKLKVLGFSKKEMILMLEKEFITISVIILLCTSLLSIVLTYYYPKMMLVFHYFKEIIPTIFDYLYAFIFMVFVLFLTYLIYIRKLNSISLIEFSKKEN